MGPKDVMLNIVATVQRMATGKSARALGAATGCRHTRSDALMSVSGQLSCIPSRKLLASELGTRLAFYDGSAATWARRARGP